MRYISTKGKSNAVSFSEAALKGLAPDGGLYLPAPWPAMDRAFIQHLEKKSLPEIGFEISRLFIDELNDRTLQSVVKETLNFEVPLVQLNENVHVLELFHGPTLAFKDFGARFMSRIFGALRQEQAEDLIILVATSGDTGSAVAQGFLGVEGIQVCLLYPSGKVSKIQEQQLTTAGQNVTALEVEGTFDDCQRLVKQAFSDKNLNDKLALSSANSINIARLLPQSFYYWLAVSQLPAKTRPIFCVPSGNFGNLTAGLMAAQMGLPRQGFIAATNANDVVPNYLRTGEFNPQPSVRTISNAMDVGNPSNFARMSALFNDSVQQMQQQIWGTSFTDKETRRAIGEVYKKHGYIMDPHTAVGYLAVQQYRGQEAGYFNEESDGPFVILSTAHPAKFGEHIEPLIDEDVPIPERLKQNMDKQKQSVSMSTSYTSLRSWLIKNYG